MSDQLNDRLKDIESKKAQLESLISEKKEHIHQRATDFKHEIEGRFNPEEIIRKNPVTSVGVSFGVGFVVGSLIKRSNRNSTPVSRPIQSASHQKSDKNISRFVSDFAYDFFDAIKDVAINAAIEYVSSKLENTKNDENNNELD